MRNKHKEKNSFIPGILKIFFLAILPIVFMGMGIEGVNPVYTMDTRIIQNIDVDTFKTTLGSSFPLIDTIYNSGNISVSFSGEIKNLVEKIFNFDIDNPMTILNSQSSMFYSYYNSGYQSMVAQEDENSKLDYSEIRKQGNEEVQDVPSVTPENASSIFYDESSDDKEPPGGGMVTSGQIALQNETNYKINIEEMLREPLKFKYDRKGPKVLIYHTHTNESFLRDASQLDKKGVPSRDNDPRYNVVRVGEELAQNLRNKYGIEVIHNATVHNYPSDIGCYNRSLQTANSILKSYPSIKVVIDLHRDGLGDDKKLRVTANVKGKKAAQVMFVMGTDKIGLKHPNWRENVKFALKLQERLNEKYPGLAKPIYISKNRYNQHVANGALIIEVGGDGNLLSECLESTKYLAEVINDVTNAKK